MTTPLPPSILDALEPVLSYLEETSSSDLLDLPPDILLKVMRAAAASAVEGTEIGYGTAAGQEGVRRQRRVVQAVARPVKTRAVAVDLGAVLDALRAIIAPPALAPAPAPPAPPTPPAAAPALAAGQAAAPPSPPQVEVEPSQNAPSSTIETTAEATAEAPAKPRARTHARTRTREAAVQGDDTPPQNPSNAREDEDLHPEVSRAAEAAGVLEEMIEEGRLTQQQALAAIHLGMGSGYSATAKMVGCDRTTLYDWRQTADFQEAVSRVTGYLARRLLEEIEGAQRLALDTLIEGLGAMKPTFGGDLVPDWQARQRCADSLLDRGGKLLKGETLQVSQKVSYSLDEDLEAKLAELEAERQALEAEQEAIDAEFAELRLLEGGAGSEDAA